LTSSGRPLLQPDETVLRDSIARAHLAPRAGSSIAKTGVFGKRGRLHLTDKRLIWEESRSIGPGGSAYFQVLELRATDITSAWVESSFRKLLTGRAGLTIESPACDCTFSVGKPGAWLEEIDRLRGKG
jgi:hypothetical protein